jgi:radical SAM protein with 4Fe4S-binding SPASM domain
LATKVEKWGDIGSDFLKTPKSLFIEISNKCNFSCAICANSFRKYGDPNEEMSLKDFTTLFNKLSFIPKKIIITGGEPFLNPDLFEILSFIEKKNINYALYTNGYTSPTTKFLNLLSRSKNLTNIAVSLHSSEPHEHELITRKKGSFQKTIKNIQKYVRYNIPTVTNTVITDKTPQNFLKMVALSESLGCDFTGFTKFVRPDGISDCSFKPPGRERFFDIFQQIKKNSIENKVAIDCAPFCEIGFLAEPCFSGRTFCSINSSGTISPCIFSNYELGNIFQTSFDSIWFSENAMKWRLMATESCLECTTADSCLGGCNCNQTKQTPPPAPKDFFYSDTDKSETYSLYKELKVIPIFDLEIGQKGIFLFNGKHVAYFKKTDLPFFEYLRQQKSLFEIEKHFGNESLIAIMNMYNESLVLLR